MTPAQLNDQEKLPEYSDSFELRRRLFLLELTGLSKKYGVCIKQDAKGNRPFIDEMTEDDLHVKYRLDEDGTLWF